MFAKNYDRISPLFSPFAFLLYSSTAFSISLFSYWGFPSYAFDSIFLIKLDALYFKISMFLKSFSCLLTIRMASYFSAKNYLSLLWYKSFGWLIFLLNSVKASSRRQISILWIYSPFGSSTLKYFSYYLLYA